MRDFNLIADQIKGVIEAKSDLDFMAKDVIIDEISKIQRESGYRAPEQHYLTWMELGNLLNEKFDPFNSRWETEIMIIFNDLKGSVDDYYDGD